MDTDKLGYTEALGIPPLRSRIAKHYRDMYGIALAEHRVVVTTGSSGGFMLAFLSAFDTGDRVALADPGAGGDVAEADSAGCGRRRIGVEAVPGFEI